MAGHTEAKDDRSSLIEDFWALVHSVAVHPKGPWGGFEVEVKGKLAALIGGDVLPQAHHNSGSDVVAGVRYIAKPTISEALFCYWRAA
jgi:site-specific DNA recombinase